MFTKSDILKIQFEKLGNINNNQLKEQKLLRCHTATCRETLQTSNWTFDRANSLDQMSPFGRWNKSPDQTSSSLMAEA